MRASRERDAEQSGGGARCPAEQKPERRCALLPVQVPSRPWPRLQAPHAPLSTIPAAPLATSNSHALHVGGRWFWPPLHRHRALPCAICPLARHGHRTHHAPEPQSESHAKHPRVPPPSLQHESSDGRSTSVMIIITTAAPPCPPPECIPRRREERMGHGILVVASAPCRHPAGAASAHRPRASTKPKREETGRASRSRLPRSPTPPSPRPC